MLNSTSNTYTLKRKILTFPIKFSRHISKPERKFSADITYGMLASGSCLLTDVVNQLHESSKKINIVDRLSRHLEKGTPPTASVSYLQQIKKWIPADPVIHIDDSDIVKPNDYKFESLGIVRDGSESTSTKSVYKMGYHVTKACVLQPVIILLAYFPKYIHLMKKIINPLIPLRFRLWNKVRLSLAMQLLPWTMATELRNRRKGKVKTNVFYKGKDHEASFHMSKYRLLHPEKIFIWYLFMVSQNIQ